MDIGLMLAATTQSVDVLGWIQSVLWTVLGVGGGLTFVIFVHELGHFLVAKACGVKCEKFYVGFDFFEIPIPFTKWKIPRSLVKFQWGETEYGLGSLPLGGYVKMLGQDDDPRNAEAEAARIKAVQQTTPGDELVPAQTVEGKTILLDERSYPAKPVPARMAIISAGVIMNMIFAVILAAIAYGMGVRELPATIGGTAPGSPAWTAGIMPGSKILQIGKRGEPHEHLRFEDLTTSVVLNGTDRDLPFLIRKPDGEKVWYDIRPSDRLKPLTKRPTVGIVHDQNREIRIRPPLAAHLNPVTNPPLEEKDRVVKLDGRAIETNVDVPALLAQKPLGPVTVQVERSGKDEQGKPKEPQIIESVVSPRPMRDIGAVMKIGPVTAIRKGSPAEEAGFQVGDTIQQVNGEAVGDPLSLAQRLTQFDAQKAVEFLVARKDRQGNAVAKTLTVQPELPLFYHSEYPVGGPAALESIGVAYDVTRTIAAVTAGGPAEKAGLQAGDVITQAQFVTSGEEAREEEGQILGKDALKPIVMDDDLKAWTFVYFLMQVASPETQLKLTWTREGKEQTAALPIENSATFFNESRGLAFSGSTEMHQAKSVGEAFSLGFREATDKLGEVVTILGSLLTRRISPTNLSGPLGIMTHASVIASQGTASLLIFLTMLSCNLAVLNFLPIPALDGGHMLFLAAEGIRGKPVDERLQVKLTIVGVVCLLSLMVFATAMDIGRFAEMIQQWFS